MKRRPPPSRRNPAARASVFTAPSWRRVGVTYSTLPCSDKPSRAHGTRSARRPPDARGAVVAGGGDAFAVGEERHAGHDAAVAFVGAEFLAGRRLPDAHAAVRVRTG